MKSEELELVEEAIALVGDAIDNHEEHEHETGQDNLDAALAKLRELRDGASQSISDNLLDKLKKLASQPCLCDREECIVYEALGSNVDDCYQRGCDDGERLMAREILTDLGIEYTIEK